MATHSSHMLESKKNPEFQRGPPRPTSLKGPPRPTVLGHRAATEGSILVAGMVPIATCNVDELELQHLVTWIGDLKGSLCVVARVYRMPSSF